MRVERERAKEREIGWREKRKKKIEIQFDEWQRKLDIRAYIPLQTIHLLLIYISVV